MNEEDLYRMLQQFSGGNPLTRLPQANYFPTPFKSGNPEMDAMFAQVLGGFAGPGKFLPQQYPSQNLYDQMVSQKYQQSMMKNNAAMRGVDNLTLARKFEQMRVKGGSGPLTPTGRAELENFAGNVNNTFTQQAVSMLIGPQAMEDAFFGRKGSAEMLGKAAGAVGFSRNDAVTGQARMSERSLEVFSKQLYENLYSNDNLSDISGLSAGRTGGMMTELAQRGLLPTSISNLSQADRAREMKPGGRLAGEIGKLGLPADVVKAFETNSPLDEIAKMEGGADAIRKVDATRVSNSLKEYSKAISTVREIFGDNGITNAPMGQLMSAMEALTQNSVSSMKPGQLDNLMRRTQMASRDAGISLEGLMGLSARAGAQADVYGLPREFAADSVVTTMERVRSLKDIGGFAPGFGRLDADKTALAMQDESIRADSSKTAKYLAVAGRVLSEKTTSGDTSQLKGLMDAIARGDTTMVDATGNTVNIYEELGRNPDEFLKPMFDKAGINSNQISALFNDPNTKEYLRNMPNRQLHLAQTAEIKSRIGDMLTSNGGFFSAMDKGGMADLDRARMAQTISKTFADASIGKVDTRMTGEERIDALRNAIKSDFITEAISQDRTGTLAGNYAAAEREAEKMMLTHFGSEAELRQTIQRQYARVGQMTEYDPNIRTSLPELQQRRAADAERRATRNKQINNERAQLFDAPDMRGDGSNILQRLNEALTSDKGGSFTENVLGLVDRSDVAANLRKEIGDENVKMFDAAADAYVKDYQSAYIDTAAERDAFMTTASGLKDDKFQKFVKDSYGAIPGLDGKKSVVSTATVADKMKTALAGNATLANAVKKIHADFDPANADHIKEVAGNAETLKLLRNQGLNFGVSGDEVTEAEMRSEIEYRKGKARTVSAAEEARFAAGGRFYAGISRGDASAQNLMSYLGHDVAGAKGKAAAEALDNYMKTGGDQKAAIAALNAAGITGDAQKKLMGHADYSKTFNVSGGANALSQANAVTESMELDARQKAILKNEKWFEKGMVDAAKKDIKDLTDDEKKALLTPEGLKGKMVAGEYEITGPDGKKTKSTSKDAAASAIEAEANQSLKKAGAVPGVDMVSQIGAGLSEAIKSAFGEEIKIQTATIENLTIGAGAAQLAAGGAASKGAPTIIAGSTQSGELSGTLEIAGDFKTAIVNLVRAQSPTIDVPPGFGATVIG